MTAVPSTDGGSPTLFALTVDLTVFTIAGGQLKLLLVRRTTAPYEGQWSLPGGPVRAAIDANLDRAAQRVLREQTGIGIHPAASVSVTADDVSLEQLRAYWRQGRDPRLPAATVAFVAIGPDLPEPRRRADAGEAAWRPVDDVLGERIALAFDHETIVRDAVADVRQRLEDTSLALAFVPEEFTLPQLRGVYEVIWGGSVQKARFYREVKKLGDLIRPTGDVDRGGAGRPAELYRRRPARSGLYPADQLRMMTDSWSPDEVSPRVSMRRQRRTH